MPALGPAAWRQITLFGRVFGIALQSARACMAPLVLLAVPFLLLLSRSAKTNPRRLVTVSVLILLGQWLDLYWLIMPEYSSPAVPLSLLDLACLLGIGGLSPNVSPERNCPRRPGNCFRSSTHLGRKPTRPACTGSEA